jgi:hypothetical protein
MVAKHICSLAREYHLNLLVHKMQEAQVLFTSPFSAIMKSTARYKIHPHGQFQDIY